MRDIMGIMKKAQEMQQQMTDAQAELEKEEVSGTSGGGLITVTLNGKGHMVSMSIENSLYDESDPTIIEDLIMAAHNDAKTKLDEHIQAKMSDVAGGLGLPEGIKLPF